MTSNKFLHGTGEELAEPREWTFGGTIRPDGQKVVVKAWTNPECTAAPVAIVLTEFVDPDGIDVYFKVPDLKDTWPVRIMDDELLSEPRKPAKDEIMVERSIPPG